MCRYAYKRYKPHFVCFTCRKQFKRPPLADVLEQSGELLEFERLLRGSTRRAGRRQPDELAKLEQRYRQLLSVCPQCGGNMIDLGRDFKPPRSSAIKTWQRLQRTYALDNVWHTCGCNGPGFVPTSQADLAAYLKDRLRTFSAKLRSAQASSQLDGAERKRQCDYWADRVAKVQNELNAAGVRAARRAKSAPDAA